MLRWLAYSGANPVIGLAVVGTLWWYVLSLVLRSFIRAIGKFFTPAITFSFFGSLVLIPLLGGRPQPAPPPHRGSEYFLDCAERAVSSRFFNCFQLTSEITVDTLTCQSAFPPER